MEPVSNSPVLPGEPTDLPGVAVPAAPGSQSGYQINSQPGSQIAPRRSSGAMLWLRDLLISAFASVLIITFLYQPVRVEGTSMLPRLEDRDRLFINKFVYHFADIKHSDVVVFRHPAAFDPQRSYIKRVIALPGDTLRVDRGRVYVNGKLLHEPYVPPQ